MQRLRMQFSPGADSFGLSDHPWLAPWEQDEVIKVLLRYGLIKFDNKRNLPLKGGGVTDIYINLRQARRHPPTLGFIADLFANPLRRMGAEQFYEIPDSVSCFAGLIADRTSLPYLTLREKAKEGRVAKADYIGEAAPGERVAGIDDVITDGESKAAPHFKARSMGLSILPFVVLVDRQQGWKQKFRELGIDVGVWPGMTLHDVRRYLIMNGLMERCSAQAEANNRMIVAVDNQADWEDVLTLLDPLRPTGSIIKFNDVIFNLGIKDLLPKAQVYGRVMADLKSHDIENTVRNITKHLLPCPPWAVTVHASGNSDMVKAAVETLRGTPTKVLAVTVLTSLKAGPNGTCEEVYRRQPLTAVKGLSKLAMRGGADGFVCSPEETPMLRGLYPQSIIVNPGTRSPGVDKHDQARVDTPANALRRGANFFVSGRQVLNAPNPVLEVIRVHRDELHIDLGLDQKK